MKPPLRVLPWVAVLSLCIVITPVCAQDSPPTNSASDAAPQASAATAQEAPDSSGVSIPGPLRSFLRMAAISQQAAPDEILPFLAHNIFSQGYSGVPGEARPTEFLILLRRYVQQARELATLAGPSKTIRVSDCDEAQPLLRVLGYRLRQGCGQRTATLVTADPERAFLTIDSGFPLPQLEETLQGGPAFSYSYPTTQVPVLFTERDWTDASERNQYPGDMVESLLHDQLLSRLYWALSRIDAPTQIALRKSPGLKKLLPFSATLDFYGSYLRIDSGKVMVPGGPSAESAWKDLIGANPDSPGDFVPKLLAKDKGWLAAYFDVLSRVDEPQREHFVRSGNLRRFYNALRGPDPSPHAARPVFRPDPGLLLLLTRLQWDAHGELHVPGDLPVWKEILRQEDDSKIARTWGKRARTFTDPGELEEALIALSRSDTDSGALQIFLSLTELDSRRSPDKRLSPATVLLLANNFSQFSRQYLIFCEFPDLNDASIAHFLKVAEGLARISDHVLRGNAMGIFQSNVGLWQILARQGEIAKADLNESWDKVIQPFGRVTSSAQLFDESRTSLRGLMMAASQAPNRSQDEIIELLAGPSQVTEEGQRIHGEMANRIRSILAAQRLVSLDTILALGDGLNEMAAGTENADTLVPLARELVEFEMPRPIFSGSERVEWTSGTYNNRHTEMQMRTDLTKIIKGPSPREKVKEARGELVPFLRDTLVGFNYAYYEPPGAQALHINPLFVRSHDFSGDTVSGVSHVWQAPMLFGEGSPAGGGAHLVGSLAELPYVLATVEQDFIVPENVQALIWKELVPGLLVSATIPRWWGVSENELHAVSLYQKTGEELLLASVGDPEIRTQVFTILSDRMAPQRLEEAREGILSGSAERVLPRITPADSFYLAMEYRRRFTKSDMAWGSAGQALQALCDSHPADASRERLSRDFGIPHPILTQDYADELLNMRPFPAFEGYSSRLLAETWDSTNLYWARLADEKGYPPVDLNRLVPQLTRRMIEKIFATHFEDWPAVLRAMRDTGEEFRSGKLAMLPGNAVGNSASR